MRNLYRKRARCSSAIDNSGFANHPRRIIFNAMSSVQEIEAAIETLPLPERLQLYKDMPQLIGRNAEDLDWQRLGLENFSQDSIVADTWEKLGPAPEIDYAKL
jgi:hypothetical protein